eukprot:comp18963_c0_seq1/m.21238 comp18963_c0_seq1/g.21238  ORF comp18963_c0_seq1/g.21238 comp18963_c0_seq1/m.21238 type:complete len:172 (-) comp18963_c0_seq1:570-1085(-)
MWFRRLGPAGEGWYEGKVVLPEDGPNQAVRVMFQEGTIQAYARHCLGSPLQPPTDSATAQLQPVCTQTQPAVAEAEGVVGPDRVASQDRTQAQEPRPAQAEAETPSLALSFSNISGLATVPRAQGAEVCVLVDVGPLAAIAASHVTAQCLQCTVGPRGLRLTIGLPLHPTT